MIKANWRYLKQLIEHKVLVFQECRRLGLPLWIALLHDWSKFRPSEWFPYADHLHHPTEFGVPSHIQEKKITEFNQACELHYKRNKHHWNHWVKDGVAEEMPEIYAREMLADWWAMARAHGNKSPLAWYTGMKMQGRMILHPETEAWVERVLGYSENSTEGE